MALAPALRTFVEDAVTPHRPLIAFPQKPIPGVHLGEPGSAELSAENATRPVEIGRATIVDARREIERQGATPDAILQPLQKWEGAVLEVDDTTFRVRLVDLTGERPEEEMELEKDELSDFDLDLLEPGAIFYWTIGYRRELPRGARERVSLIRFRRFPAWSRRELASAHKRAEEARRELGW